MATTATRPTLGSGQKKSSMDLPEGGGSPPARKLSRSQSITSSTIPAHIELPPEMESQWKKRRESLEKLQLDKSQKSPWVLMHDFSENDPEKQRLEQLRQQFSKRRQSIEKLQLDPRGPEVKPWMLLHNFDGDSEEPASENPQ